MRIKVVVGVIDIFIVSTSTYFQCNVMRESFV